MRKRTLLVIGFAFTILLAACGSGTPQSPQAILQKMHERIMEGITKAADNMEVADVSATKMKIHLKVNPIPGILPMSAIADIASNQTYDVKTDKQHPTMGLTLDATVEAEDTSADSTINVKLSTEAKAIGGKLFVQLKDGTFSMPAMGLNAAISEKVKKAWYGTTFDEINTMINGNLEMQREAGVTDDLASIDVEKIILNAINQQREMPEKLKTLAKSIHLWKPIETLPEENGMLRVRVESDAAKMEASMSALLDFAIETNNPLGMPEAASDPTMKEEVATIRDETHQFFDTNKGTVRGIVMADKKTYDFTGFDGEVVDGSGATTGTIHFIMQKNGDITFTASSTESPDEKISFTKKGEAVELTSGAQTILKGTMSRKKIHLEGFDEAGATQIIADFDIAKADADTLNLSGKVTIPSAGVDIIITKFVSEMRNSYKDVTTDLAATVNFQDQPVADITLEAIQKEESSIGIATEKVFLPINALMVDLQPFMQQLGM